MANGVFTFLGLGSFVYIGHRLSVAISLSPELEQPTASRVFMTLALIFLWLFAFRVGVKIRPEQIPQSNTPPRLLPLRSSLLLPIQIILYSLIFGLLFIIGFGVVVGHVIGIGILKSLLWAFLGSIFNPFITFILFVPTTFVTVKKLYGSPLRPSAEWIMIARACRQRMWLFSGLSVLIVYGVSRWIAGSIIYESPYLIAASASLAYGVFSTGFASAFIRK